MRDMRRHQKKLERMRRKREERRAELGRRDHATYEVVTDHTYATNVSSEVWSGDVAAWPVVRAYVPVRDVWRATGLGLAGVVRQQPDGRHASAFFMLELSDLGLKGAFGNRDESLDDIDRVLASTADECPPAELGPVELAAEFAWGARALASAQGAEFPPAIDRFFALMPQPRGTPRDWKARFTGPGGLTPAELVRVVRENPPPDDLPAGKEQVLLTEATFSIDDGQKAVADLRRARPEFAYEGRDGGADQFNWTRKPSGWSPLDLFARRQVIGSVRVAEGRLVAEAATLTMAAKLIARLRETVGAGLRLEDCRWTGQRALLRTAPRRG